VPSGDSTPPRGLLAISILRKVGWRFRSAEIVDHPAIGLPGLTQTQHLKAEADMQLRLGAHGPVLGIVGQDAPVDRDRLLEVTLDLFRVDAGLEKALRSLLAEGRRS